MAWCRRSGLRAGGGSQASSARSTRARYAGSRSAKGTAAGRRGTAAVAAEVFEGRVAVLLHQLLHAQFRLLELLLAGTRQLDAALELLHGLFERQLAGFHAFDQGFELGQGFLELADPAFLFAHGNAVRMCSCPHFTAGRFRAVRP
jgi:hypothetical protein